ncbi:DUF2147 domain-containing protein [Sphingomonas abietis]|uniref:DUF2147 domain-containing protein n=1 Tax=Sphingomonas abietis TaxID=3012344 RepID=A0ABY7NU53_9SPHN|nr:DUF2147 domain-containing protein [Sphingomonas abietis]WBO22986.1 DUF2147 domain-containing protein [Sphingomonas abietis]
MLSTLFAALLAAQSSAPSPDSVIGTWHSPTKNGVIAIQHCGSSICGTLENGDDIRAHPDAKDVNNKDAAQRGRTLKGLTMLSGFAKDGDVWTGGKVYNPNDGGTYSGKITPVDADTLKLRGCIIWPACKTETWTRIR